MSLFKQMFSSRNHQKKEIQILWQKIDDLNQLNTIKEESKEKTVVIFKHSTRCGISRMALNRFEKNFDSDSGKLSLYLLDLLAHRNISNEIAFQFKVHHESPQLIVIQNGKAVYHASHSGIDAKDLNRF